MSRDNLVWANAIDPSLINNTSSTAGFPPSLIDMLLEPISPAMTRIKLYEGIEVTYTVNLIADQNLFEGKILVNGVVKETVRESYSNSTIPIKSAVRSHLTRKLEQRCVYWRTLYHEVILNESSLRHRGRQFNANQGMVYSSEGSDNF